MDSSPKESSSNGQIPERTFSRRAVPRMTFHQMDIFPNGHFHESHFFIKSFFAVDIQE